MNSYDNGYLEKSNLASCHEGKSAIDWKQIDKLKNEVHFRRYLSKER